MQILSGVLGAAQIAMVLAKPLPDIPAYAKGTLNASRGLALVGEAGRELVTKNGKTSLISEPTLLNMSGGENVLNNKETERFMANSNIHKMGYDSQDVKNSIEQGNARIVSAIKGKTELHISASGDKITERSGSYYKTYFNKKIKWAGKQN